jgi:uncharacterized protein YgiM (DUF1202 family)
MKHQVFKQLMSISYLLLFILIMGHIVQAETYEPIKIKEDMKIVSDKGAEIEVSAGAEFFGNKVNEETYIISLNNHRFSISNSYIEEIESTSEKIIPEEEAQLHIETLPEGTVLRLTDGHGSAAVTLHSDIEAFVNDEGTHVVVGSRYYKLEIETPEQPTADKKDEPAAEASSEESSYTFDEERTFRALGQNVSIKVRQTNGELLQTGKLIDQADYHLIRSTGNWLEIQYGSETAFIWKEAAKPVSREQLQAPVNSGRSSLKFEAASEAVVYDNSSGELIPFAKLDKGTQYPYLSQTGNWLKVELAGRTGYVYADSVKPLEQPIQNYQFIKISSGNTTVYSNEGGSLTPLGYVDYDEVFKKGRDVGNWYEVTFAGKKAYIWKEATEPVTSSSETFLEETGTNQVDITQQASIYDNSSGSLEEIGKLYEGQSVQVISVSGDWYLVNILGRKAFIHESAVKNEFLPTDLYYEVSDSSVPFVINENGTLKEIGYLERGAVYKRTGETGNWHIIDVMGKKAFVWKDATKPASKTSGPFIGSIGEWKFTLTEDVTIYDNSLGSLYPIAQLKKGQSYQYISRSGNWVKLNISGREAYLYHTAVKDEFVSKDKYFEVQQDNLSIMKNVNGNLIEMGTLQKGDVYKRVKDAGNWHQIDVGNETAYVWKNATAPYRGSALPKLATGSAAFGITALKNLGVFDNSSGSLQEIGMIKEGTSFRVTGVMGDWYRISFLGREAYVYGPAAKKNASLIVNPRQIYTYDQMVKDLQAIAEMYPGLTELTTIGTSVDGRKLYAMKLGKGSREIMVDASTHAREHMTTNVVMSMLDNYAYHYNTNQLFEGMNVRKILDETSIWFVPMVNPDGVTLVQKGYQSAKNPAEVMSINGFSTDFSSWKANIRGVDINRQFPADWENVLFNTGKPSPKNYKGTAPLTEPEAIAMANFAHRHNFKAAANYHSSGEILYWYFNQTTHYSRDYALARKLGQITGYSLVEAVYQPSAAFQDWFIYQTGYPAFTIEISPYVVEGEVPLNYFDRIWRQNKTIGLVIAQESRYY